MNQSYYLLLMAILFLLSSCVTNKEDYLSDFEKFVQEVEAKKTISEDEMKKVSAQFQVYSQKYYDKFKEAMTTEDVEEVARLEVRY